MIINHHKLDDSNASGNGHHGHCLHCGLALVTDLGYCSWDGAHCIDREVVDESDMPSEILRYARFNGLIWNEKKKLFIKPYSSKKFTLDRLVDHIDKIRK